MRASRLYIFLTIVITLWSQTACNSADSEADASFKADPAAVSAAVSRSDALFKQREDVQKLRDAVTLLGRARVDNPRSFDLEWRFAKFNYFLGKQIKDDKEAAKIFGVGRDAGRIASNLEPSKPDGYFWYGANLGEIARVDPLSGLTTIKDIQAAMYKVLEIQPDYQLSSAYDGLAQVELETTGLLGGSAQKAADFLEKALQNERNNAYLHLHLADAYLELKRPADARKQLEAIAQMKPTPDYEIEYRECLDESKKMLASKFSS
jgi:tetratricopeptide (TPR) repeat protein